MVPVIVVGLAPPAFFKVKSKRSFEKFATETPELISSILCTCDWIPVSAGFTDM